MRKITRAFRCRRIILLFFILIGIILLITYFRSNEKHLDIIGSVVDVLPDLNSVQIQPPDNLEAKIHIEENDVDIYENKKQRKLNPFRLGTPMSEEEIRGGEPTDPEIAALRNRVRQMMKLAWDGYVKHAWGSNELKPISQVGHLPFIFGSRPLGLSIVDGLDTLYIMKLDEEFNKAMEWIEKELNFDANVQVSLFEINIRYVGSLLSTYTFTRRPVLLNKLVNLVDHLLPAFDTATGIPMSLINLKTGIKHNFAWAKSQCSILSEVGTLHMEFMYLSELTGNEKYAKLVKQIRKAIDEIPRHRDLYFNYINPESKIWCDRSAGLSALGDSFYEYLLKEWIRTNRTDIDARRMYDSSINAFMHVGLFKKSKISNLTYVGNYQDGTVSLTMHHLSCFVGGMLALGSTGVHDSWFQTGVEVTKTCRKSYESTPSGLGPDIFTFTDTVEAVAIKPEHKGYFLRPETVESYFYLWRFTKDPKYRNWAKDVVEALETHARTKNGFAGILDVYSSNSSLDDVQQSYFLAETLKYLYLIFSEDSLLPLDRWVFNTEAHPLPVQTKVRLDI